MAIITNRIILHSQIRYEDRDARDGSPHPDDLDSATLLIIEIAYKPKSHPERVLRPYVGVGLARLQNGRIEPLHILLSPTFTRRDEAAV